MTDEMNSTEAAQRRRTMLANPHWAILSDESRDAIIEGELALAERRARNTFDDWLKIGHACVELQQAAMRRSNSSTPLGRRYAEMYSLMAPPELGDMDKANRSRAIALYHRADEIRPWYDRCSKSDQDRMQHPQTILARFQAWQKREGVQQPGERPDEPGDGRQRPDEPRRRAGQAAAIDDATERLHHAVDGIERKVGPSFDELYDFSEERIDESAENFLEIHDVEVTRRWIFALEAALARRRKR